MIKKLLIGLAIVSVLFAPPAFAATQFIKDTGGTLMTSIVSYYKFASGAGLVDSINTAYNLTDHGTVTFPTSGAPQGNSAAFNGSSQYLSLASAYNPNGANFSVNIWLKATDYSNTQATAWLLDENTQADSMNIQYNGSNGNVIGWNWGVNATYGKLNSTFASTGTWAMFTLTSDGTTISGYLNGSSTPFAQVNKGNLPSMSYLLEFGFNTFPNTAPYYWKGSVAQYGFWSKVLSSTEITDLYNAGAGNTVCTVGVDCPATAAAPIMQVIWVE